MTQQPDPTPGSWHINHTDDGLEVLAGDLLIATVNGSTKDVEVVGLDERTTDANASLIAAAPDLLAAPKRVLELGERANLFHWEDAEVIGEARAAKGKFEAKGRSPNVSRSQ
jgi:hypothetical protein